MKVQRETYDRLGTLLSISRGCVSTCPYGCYYYNYGPTTLVYYYNYGPTTLVCISCCRSTGCNVGNGSVSTSPSNRILLPLLMLLFAGLMPCSMLAAA